MSRQLDFFGRPPRKPGRKLMYVIDAGNSPGGEMIAQFQCLHCQRITDWLILDNEAEGRRGIPCPACNPQLELDYSLSELECESQS